MTFRQEEGDNEMYVMSIRKELWQFSQKVRAISGQFQHALVVANIDLTKIRKEELMNLRNCPIKMLQ